MGDEIPLTRNVTEEEFARLVGFHRESIAKMRREGKIDHCKQGRKVWYLIPDHLTSFNLRAEKKAAA